MKILILSFYYSPDLCPGSFRCTAFVEQLRQLVGPLDEIEVITTIPNRYATFSALAPEVETQHPVTIKRIKLPTHQSGMVDQTKAFIYFSREVMKLVEHSDYSLVFATSSRLMTALLGSMIARRKKAKLYLDIRDIFVDTLDDVLPANLSLLAKPVFSWVEKYAFKQAHRINLISPGFEDYFRQRYPHVSLSAYTHGIDSEFLPKGNTPKHGEEHLSRTNRPLIVLYAGNIGEGQGLHLIIPFLAKRMEGRIHFRLIGDGGRKSQLVSEITMTHCSNVELLPPMNREELIEEYEKADVLFLHLNDYAAFYKVLPSKLFEYAASGKPIWAGVSGYAAKFIQSEISNAAIFSPCNIFEAEHSFSSLNLVCEPRPDFIQKYKRQQTMHSMASDLLSLLS
jgi:glycosyltransferase involved in cell wall biosynthesis